MARKNWTELYYKFLQNNHVVARTYLISLYEYMFWQTHEFASRKVKRLGFEDSNLLVHYAVSTGKSLPTFQEILMPKSSIEKTERRGRMH